MVSILDETDRKWLKDLLGDRVKFDEAMAKHTSLRVGGPADAYVLPKNQGQLNELMDWIRHKNIPHLIIGGGTNLLVKDNGIRAIAISLTECLNGWTQTDVDKDKCIINVLAGTNLRALCRLSLARGLAGMNFALGIPGTIGGGIKMNAGTTHGAMENVLQAVSILLPQGKMETIDQARLKSIYRHPWENNDTDLTREAPVILSGSFLLSRTDSKPLKEEAKLILENRKNTQPLGWPSAGCFFKNPSFGKTAGFLIDRAGLKGRRKGNAEISVKHANFILNKGKASAADILALMELVQDTVLKTFNIRLEPEVKIVGH